MDPIGGISIGVQNVSHDEGLIQILVVLINR